MDGLTHPLTLAAGTAASAADRLVIAATPVPHAEILEFVKPMLAKEGVELEVKVFTDYVQPSMQTNEKRVDGNFFLHQPYLDEFKKKQKNDIQTVVTKVHVEPLGAYSAKHKAVADIPEGATGARFICDRTAVHAVATWLGKNGWSVVTAEIGYLAKQFPELDETQRAEVGEFLQDLDDHDDVQRVWAALK